jgi:hypothetical protein
MNKLLTDTKIFYLIDENFKEKNKFNVEEYMNINGNLWGNEFSLNSFSNKKINFVNFANEFNIDPIKFNNISIEDLDDLLFKNSVYHNIKALLYFKESNITSNRFKVDVLFNSAALDYSFVLKNWIFSNYFKNELGIYSDLCVIKY